MSTVIARPLYETRRVLSFAFRRWLTIGSIVFADCATITIAVALASGVGLWCYGPHHTFGYALFLAGLAVFLAVFVLNGLYPGVPNNPIVEFRKILHSLSISSIILISSCFVMRDDQIHASRVILTLVWVFTFLLVPVGRWNVRRFCSRFSWWGIPTFILGTRESGQEILKMLTQQSSLGLRPIAILDEHGVEHSDNLLSEKLSEKAIPYATASSDQHSSCYAIVALPHLSSEELSDVLTHRADKYSRVLILPDLYGMSSLFVAPRDINGMLGLEIHQGLTQFLPQAVKRCCDIAITLTAGILLAPVIVFVYLAVRFTSPGPVFYGQRRIGRNNEEFTAWKFRSMVMNADTVLQKYLSENPSLREEWEKDHKLKRDPRITTIGRILRKTSLDELPQLWNVLCGQMSLVGPRPIVSAEVHKYGKRFNHYRRVKPGITGLWQTSGRNNTTYEVRTRLDEYYVRNWSVSLDLYILIRTLKTVLFTEGAY